MLAQVQKPRRERHNASAATGADWPILHVLLRGLRRPCQKSRRDMEATSRYASMISLWWARCRLGVIFDGFRRFWLPVDFRLAPKADLRQ